MKVEVLQPLGKAEMLVLSLVLTGGYTSREEIAKKCGETGLDVGERSVSRYLEESYRKRAPQEGGERLRGYRTVSEAISAGHAIGA